MKRKKRAACAALAAVMAATALPLSAGAYSMTYPDVPQDHWAYQDILYTSQWGFFNGKADGNFHPDDTLTRAEFVSILARIANAQVNRFQGTEFTDVNDDDWFAGAVAWASRRGIISGVGDDRFDPNGVVTREQMATLSYNFLKSMGIVYGSENGEVPYTDKDQISDWALTAVKGMYSSGIMTGREDNTFDPQATTSRAEAASIARRLYADLDYDYRDETENQKPETDSGTEQDLPASADKTPGAGEETTAAEEI